MKMNQLTKSKLQRPVNFANKDDKTAAVEPETQMRRPINEFRQPILSAIYNVIGVLVVTIGLGTAIFALTGSGSLHGEGSSVVTCIVILAVTAIVSLTVFGVAQVITYIGRTAYHAQSIDQSLAAKMDRMQKTVNALSEQLTYQVTLTPPPLPRAENAQKTTMADPDQRRPQTTPTPPVQPSDEAQATVNCPNCNVEIPLSDIHTGTNTCAVCGRSFEAE